MGAEFDRRELIKLLTASAVAVMPLQLSAAKPDAPLFFSREEFALVDALTELIIPRDSHSPGAHEAGVAEYIDRSVAEAFLPEEKEAWTKGLAEINRLATEGHKKPFLRLNKAEQVALLKKLSKGEDEPNNEGQKFFGLLKSTTVFGYYTSEIGIHKEMEYKGNTLQQQFSGFDAV